MDYPATTRKIEDLPSDGGKVVDVLAGAILRLFIRLGEIDAALGRHDRRLAALEGGVRPQPAPARTAPPSPREEPDPGLNRGGGDPAAGGVDPEADPVPHRGRGRPPGSRNKPKPNGFDHHDDDRGGLDPERDLTL